MNNRYYSLGYRLDNCNRYLIWCTIKGANQDLDTVVLDANGKIPVFSSLDNLLAYAQTINVEVEKQDELHLHNLDVLLQWFKVKRSKIKARRPLIAANFSPYGICSPMFRAP